MQAVQHCVGSDWARAQWKAAWPHCLVNGNALSCMWSLHCTAPSALPQCPAWHRCNLECRVLTKVWRQSDQVCLRFLAFRLCPGAAALQAMHCQHACTLLAPLLARIHHSVAKFNHPPRPLFNAPQAFVSILNAVRFGDNAAAQRLYQQCRRPLAERDGIKPTQVGPVAVGL